VIGHAVAVRFQLLPEVVDVSYVLTFSGFGGLLATMVAAALRFDADRLARLVVLGNLLGGLAGTLAVALVALGVVS
jgi:hypothetical protein